MRGRTAENRSRCPTRTTAVEAADSLASGGRSSDEKQNNETLGTGKAKKVYKSTITSGRHFLYLPPPPRQPWDEPPYRAANGRNYKVRDFSDDYRRHYLHSVGAVQGGGHHYAHYGSSRIS